MTMGSYYFVYLS
jgi:hypothetical protein